MPAPRVSSRGTLIISVDIPATGGTHGPDARQDAVARGLRELLDAFGCPATWAVPHPGRWSLASGIADPRCGHELAVLGDPRWLGPGVPRPDFARELSQRVLAARAAGLSVDTLAGTKQPARRDLDLLVKFAVRATRVQNQPGSPRQPGEPRALRYGVWDLPVHAVWPHQPLWWVARQVRLGIKQSGSQRQLFHLRLDVQQLLEGGRYGLSAIETFLREVAYAQRRDGIEVLTLGESARRLAHVPRPAPARSILRAA